MPDSLKNKQAVLAQQFQQLQIQFSQTHPELTQYQLKFNHTKRVLGSCHYLKKVISISNVVLQQNSLDVQLDTLNHEVAHALAYMQGERGHGKIWKYWAVQLGATPKSRTQTVIQNSYKYQLVRQLKGELIELGRGYHKKISLKNRYIPSDKSSLNQLFLVETEQLKLFKSQQIKLSEVRLHQ